MNLKVYEKTRYQNIYRHKKNGNYVIQISNPKTSISRMPNGNKIWNKDDAIKIRDNKESKLLKQSQLSSKVLFGTAWDKYIEWCKNDQNQKYSTYNKKEKIYNKHLRILKNKIVSKITEDYMKRFISGLSTTDKQKNEVLQKALLPFFNWCMIEEKIILINPVIHIKKIRVQKPKIDYWTIDEVTQFFTFINEYINSDIDIKQKEVAYRVKMYSSITFALGDRIGETRALFFDSFDDIKEITNINHSIDYNPNNKIFITSTKTVGSERIVDTSKKILQDIKDYKNFLIQDLGYPVKNDSLIFFNYSTNKPFSDTLLRNNFYKFCKLAKVPKITPYALRHTHVATLMAEGKPLYQISPRIGHTRYDTTVTKYGHLERTIRKEIANTTDKYF